MRKTMADYDFDTETPNFDGEEITRRITLRPTFSGDYFKSIVPFPVIVERWDHLCGSKKRRYLEEFTPSERATISRWYHQRFYRWYLIMGTPKMVQCSMTTVELLRRACNFFASI